MLVGIPVILFLVLILICHWGIDVWEDKQHDRLQDKLATRPNLSPDPSPNPNPNPSPSPSPNPSPSPSPSPSPHPKRSPDPDQSLDEARRASSLFFCEARTGFEKLQTVAEQG